MGKRKKVNTLTKIDPAILMPKPLTALSQHESHRGIRVTTTVKPVVSRLTPTLPPEPFIFDADPLNFAEEYLDGGGNNEDVSEGCFSAQVSLFIIARRH